MNRYVIANLSTGEIVRTVVCPEWMSDSQAAPGEVIAESNGGVGTHYWSSGSIVAYTQSQLLARANRPSYWHQWSNSSMAWVDGRSLAQAKDDKWEAMKQARAAAIEADFVWDGSTFQADMPMINGAVSAALAAQAVGGPFSKVWTLADNTTRTLDADDMVQVGLALVAQVDAAHARSRVVRQEIDACQTLEEVAAIAW